MAAATILTIDYIRCNTCSQVGQVVMTLHQIFAIEEGGVDLGYKVLYETIDIIVIRSRNVPTKKRENGQTVEKRHQFFEIRDGGNRHVGIRLPGVFQHHRCVAIKTSQHNSYLSW